MLTLRVRVNEEPVVVGGMGGMRALTLILGLMGGRAAHLHLSGTTSDGTQNVKWLGRELVTGDRLSLEIVEADAADPAPERSPMDDAERLYYEMAKAAYFRMRDKYEPQP